MASTVAFANNDSIAVAKLGAVEFVRGDLVGVFAGEHVLAEKDVARVYGVCSRDTGAASLLFLQKSGLRFVLIEDGVTVSPGDAAYLSEQAGRATNVPGTGGGVQPLGSFLAEKETTGRWAGCALTDMTLGGGMQ